MGRRKNDGAIWVKNIATPKLTGTAISSAKKEEISVPHNEGAAPNSPMTGSQDLALKKSKPKSFTAGIADCVNCHPMATINNKTKTAQTMVNCLNTRRPSELKRNRKLQLQTSLQRIQLFVLLRYLGRALTQRVSHRVRL